MMNDSSQHQTPCPEDFRASGLPDFRTSPTDFRTSFEERFPAIVTPNPGGPQDPLGESVLDPMQSWLRVFEPTDVRAVIGRGQDPTVELQVAALSADRVPVHRRVCGGGAVVLAPGMLVVALRLPRGDRFPDAWLAHIAAVLAPAVATATGAEIVTRGHGDLALREGDGERKVLGASLRLTGPWCIYLGVLLVADAVPLMERYLAHPSREPTYRAGRGHGAFCTHLGRFGSDAAELGLAVEAACHSAFA